MRRAFQNAYRVTSVDVHRPVALSSNVKSELAPPRCLIPPVQIGSPFLNPSAFSSGGLWRLSDRQRRSGGCSSSPSRSAEVWPLCVPALSQLSHRACSPDCTVTHWVVSLWCLMHCACLHHISPPQESSESLIDMT